jgi:spore coat protein H
MWLLLACTSAVVSTPTDNNHDDTDPHDTDPRDTAPPDDTEVQPEGEDRCGLSLTPGSPYITEGETVTLTAACAQGDPADFALSFSGPDGLVIDGLTATWQTTLTDGGRHELYVSAQPISGGVEELSGATVWVAEAIFSPDNTLTDPADYTEEWALPVVHITAPGAISQSYTGVEVVFMGQTYDAQLKIRGAASAGYPKPSYLLRFGDVDLDARALGMGSKDHLVLITPFDDNTYVRQKLVYDTWTAMAEYADEDRLTPRTAFVVAYLNGDYLGLYTACDRIDDHFMGEMGLSEEGNLYKAVNHDANFYLTSSSGAGKSTLHDGYEKKEGLPAGDYSDLDALVAFTGAATATAFIDEAGDWLPLEEFMDWFLLVHYASAADSAGKNSYIYHDPDSGLFRFAPWDFNHSWGQGWYTYRVASSTNENFKSTNAIFAHIQNHPEAGAALWSRFHDMVDDGPLNPDTLRGRVDDYYDLIDASAERDWAVWGSVYSGWWGSYNSNSFRAEQDYLYTWLDERHDWMMQYHPE